jgi:hypothetical protein
MAVRGSLDRAEARLGNLVLERPMLTSPRDVPTIVALAISTVAFAVLLPGAIRAWKTYAGVSTRRQQDVTGTAPVPGRELSERIVRLEAIGYRRIGETLTPTPSSAGYAWVLAADDGLAYALLVREASLTGFYSTWPDGTWLGTLHPSSTPYETEGLRIRIERGTLERAEARHRADVVDESRRRGTPRPIRGLADVLDLDLAYRRRFGGQELRPLLYRALFPVALAGFLVAYFVVALFVLP